MHYNVHIHMKNVVFDAKNAKNSYYEPVFDFTPPKEDLRGLE